VVRSIIDPSGANLSFGDSYLTPFTGLSAYHSDGAPSLHDGHPAGPMH
jgi:hypothetical protein